MKARASAWRPAYEGGKVAAWVRELAGRSGVYLIREAGARLERGESPRYVGSSTTGRLKKTLLHHFQSWRDGTGGHTDGRGGVTYARRRERMDVRVYLTAPSEAPDLEAQLIAKWDPPDNTIGRVEHAKKRASTAKTSKRAILEQGVLDQLLDFFDSLV